MVVDVFEDSKKQGDVFYDKLVIANINTVQYVVRMFDEEEYARTENFLTCRGKHKG